MPYLYRPLFPLVIVSLIAPTCVWAGNTAVSDTAFIDERDSRAALTDEQRAKQWGLRAEDWKRYRQLQQGPLGIYSPNLDPLTALGIEAQTDDERQRYAELQVRAESARVSKELAYQRAYDQAWKRLYPDLQSVTLTDHISISKQDSQRFALFITDNCTPCNRQVKQLQTAAQPFDLYMVDSNNDDARLRQWAKRIALDPTLVRDGKITLNHDGGRWASLGVTGELPALVREVNGQWQRQ